MIQLGRSKTQTLTMEKTEKAVHTCVDCEYIGDGLVGNYHWVGNQSDILVYECLDLLDTRCETLQKACEALGVALQHEGISALC